MALTLATLLLMLAVFELTSSQYTFVDNSLGSSDLFSTLLPRRRSQYLPLMLDEAQTTRKAIVPCSLPDTLDPRYTYPEYPECKDGSCPVCKPIQLSVSSTRKPVKKPFIKPRPPTSYAILPRPLPGGNSVTYSSTNIRPSQQYEGCPMLTFSTVIPQPFQCPYVDRPQQRIDPEYIRNIIGRERRCLRPMECSTSISELLLRINLLQERLRGVALIEARLNVQTQLLAQIEIKIGGNNMGNRGPRGEVGFQGSHGPRGGRGPQGKCNTLGRPSEVAGPPGQDGIRGAPGQPGNKVCGCDGEPGYPGFLGYSIQGQIGQNGNKGAKGSRGTDATNK